MGIGSFVEGSLSMYVSERLDVALALACSAVDATSARAFPSTKKNNERYKNLLRENLLLVTSFGFPGIMASEIRIRCTPASGLSADATGYVGIEDILYHTVRCGLVHECDIDRRIQFTSETSIGDFDSTFSIPRAIVLGLLSVAILHPVNRGERAEEHATIQLGADRYRLNDLWGTGSTIVRLPDAQFRISRLHNAGLLSLGELGGDTGDSKT
jgi:hypothetical protein